MVPCQPRQLVILSLPFAALVAFFWYKRRKNLSRSDPGGTAALTKPVDKTASVLGASESVIEPETVSCNSTKVGENISVKSVEVSCDFSPIAEKSFLKKSHNIVSLTPKQKETFLEPVVERSVPTFKESNICNSDDDHPIGEPEIVNISCEEFENSNSTTTDFETSKVFHSTVIEKETKCEKTNQQPVNKSSESSELKLESICDSYSDPSEDNKTIVETTENKDLNKTIESEKEQIYTQLFKGQTTLKSIDLKDPILIEDIVEKSIENLTELVLPLKDRGGQSDFIKKLNSSVSSNSSERLGDVSTDTGVGSQDLSNPGDSPDKMAQGQKAEEKTQSSSTGLEQKLASLGLDTQQPTQRTERDSANHSPAEVMLNSPAISTFSDAHSEGSSDSGKGCSDVVTPAGGSSVAGDQLPIIYEFVLPQVIVGRLIGRHGAYLHDIRSKTHTNIFIKRHPDTNSLKICAIEGTQPDIDAALKMIRQKFPLRRFPDLTLERVTFVKNSSLPINPENLQLNLVEGVNNDVILSSLITAGHFFLQMPMHISYQSLYRLACIMNSVYNTQESPPLPNPQPDIICVAPAHGGWYRAQILSVDEENHTSDIRFLDYGGFLTVDNTTLRQIRGDFLLLPFQAVECALANVIPAGGEEEWSEEAKQFVQMMTTQQTLQAQVYDYTETGMPLVYLYSTQFYQSPTDSCGFETKVVLLNQELVSRGFADLIDVIQDDKQAPESS